MTPEPMIAKVLMFCFLAATLWGLWLWFVRDYLVDRFRQQMFELRDRLFDEADSGLIAFDSRAYGILRGTMNGFIRFGHRLSAAHLLLTAALTLTDGGKRIVGSFEEEWLEATKDLPRRVRDRLDAYRDEMMRIVGFHIMQVSPFFTLLVVIPVGLLVFALAIVLLARDRAERLRSRLLDSVESAALAYGKA